MTRGLCVIVCVYLSINSLITEAAGKLEDVQLHRLPKLFHLDDYDRCLSQEDGVFCLGTFELTPTIQPHPIYELMKEHTNQPLKYNRTLLRRGYCVSERCPLERNSTLGSSRSVDATVRFERCVARFTARHALSARLRTAHYCITHKQHQEKATHPKTDGQQMYLYAIYAIVLFNVIGTWYDVNSSQDSKRNSLLMAWSLPSNWGRLTRINDSGIMAALAPLQSVRLVVQLVIMFVHTALLHYMVHVTNPESLEKFPRCILGTIIRNGTSLVQIYILISCFLTGYNLLLTSQKSEINLVMIVKWILKRLIRILPVYLLVLGFAVTWWGRVDDGPLWAPIVGTETKICQRKFWYQIFFVSNLLEASEPCLLQSWALAVDMQLYLLSLFLTVMFIKLKVRAVPILGWCFAATGALNIILAYVGNWDPMIKMLTPENLRVIFRNTPSFPNIHTSPWSNMPACFLGLFMAHYYYEMTKKITKVNDQKIETENTNGYLKKSGSNDHLDNEVVKSNEHSKNCVGINGHINNGIQESNGYTKNSVGENDTHLDKEDDKNDEHTMYGVDKSNGHVNNEIDANNRFGKKNVGENNAHVHKENEKNNGYAKNGEGDSNGRIYNGILGSNWHIEKSVGVNNAHVEVEANNKPANNELIHNGNNKTEVGEINAVVESKNSTYNYNGFNENNLRHRHVANERNGHIYTENVLSSNDHSKNYNERNGLKDRESNGHTNIVTTLSNGCNKNKGLNGNGHTYNVIGESNGHAKNGIGERNGNVQAKAEYKKDCQKKMLRFLLRYSHVLAMMSLVLWVLLGSRIEETQSRALIAGYVGMERVMFSLMTGVVLIHLFTIDDGMRRAAAWRGWHALGRLSYSITMLHWCVNVTIAAGRSIVIPSSTFYMSLDWLATIFYSTILSLPVYLLVELPVQRFLDILMKSF